MALEPLHAAAERGDRALALLIGAERSDEREASARLLGLGARRLGRGCRPDRARSASDSPRRLFVIGFEHRPQPGNGRYLRLGFFLAKALLGLLFSLALGLFLVLAAILLVALARFGGLAVDALALKLDDAALRLLLGDAALLGLARARVGECMRPGIALVIRQRAQHNARRLRRGYACGRRDRARRRLDRGPRRRCSPLGGRCFDEFGFARYDDAALHLLHDHLLRAAV